MDFHSTNKLIFRKENVQQEKKLKCEFCNVIFRHEESLAYHKLNDHPSPTNPTNIEYKCDMCGKSFWKAGYLKTHLNTVHKSQI